MATDRDPLSIADLLRAGKARLLERGWCQGDKAAVFGPPNGPCCAATAMRPRDSDWTNPKLKPIDFFRKVNGISFRKVNGISSGLGAWNDAPERTLEDVLAAYDKAIAAAEATEKPE